MYTYIHIYIHTDIYIYIHIYICTYIHIYTYTHIYYVVFRMYSSSVNYNLCLPAVAVQAIVGIDKVTYDNRYWLYRYMLLLLFSLFLI